MMRRTFLVILAMCAAALAAGCGSGSTAAETTAAALATAGGPASTTPAPPPSSSSAPPSSSGTQPSSTPKTSTTTKSSGGQVTGTFVGDSVPASIDYVPAAQKVIEKGLKIKLDLKVCRRLVAPSCTYQGVTPPTALSTVKSYGSDLGDVLIVDVGYNDYSGTYRDDMQAIIKQADQQGVKGIVWVTMRQARSSYDWTNHVIHSEARRYPNVVVADWNALSTGKPWFGPDGLHLTDSGATNLARFLRPFIYQAAQGKK